MIFALRAMVYARAAMNLSRSSRPDADPLSNILAALGTRSLRRTWLEASGSWALSFPAIDRLKFVAVLKGACWFIPAQGPAQPLSTGDVVLIGRTDYEVASDPAVPPVAGLSLHAVDGDRLHLGGDDVLLVGGGVTFTPGTSSFLLDMLPASLVVGGSSHAAGAIAAVLALLDREARAPGLGSEAITARLAEVLVVEAIRFHANDVGAGHAGWLGALVDPKIGRALHSFHLDIARPWTVSMLAAEAAMSRAAFSAAFLRRVGRPPLDYVRAWRLTLARARLVTGAPIASVAIDVGYTSQSAFAYAYRRFFGSPPGKRQ